MMDYIEMEIEGMKEILRDKEKYIKKLEKDRDFFKEQATLWRNDYKKEYEENKELKERIRFLEQCLDNKEKVNKSLREELEIWKLTAKDYARQCWVDLDDDLDE